MYTCPPAIFASGAAAPPGITSGPFFTENFTGPSTSGVFISDTFGGSGAPSGSIWTASPSFQEGASSLS